jgi:hypothetical protein
LKTTNITVPDELYKALKKASKKTNQPMAQIIRDSLVMYLTPKFLPLTPPPVTYTSRPVEFNDSDLTEKVLTKVPDGVEINFQGRTPQSPPSEPEGSEFSTALDQAITNATPPSEDRVQSRDDLPLVDLGVSTDTPGEGSQFPPAPEEPQIEPEVQKQLNKLQEERNQQVYSKSEDSDAAEVHQTGWTSGLLKKFFGKE